MNDYKHFLDNGIFDIQDGKYSDAIEKITQSLNLKNDWEIPYFYRGVAHHALSKFDDGKPDFLKRFREKFKMYKRCN